MGKRVRSILKHGAGVLGLGVLVAAIYLGVSLRGLTLKPGSTQSVDAIAQELVERQLLPSISFAIIESGEITSSRTIGFGDIASAEIADARTLYEAASLTKPLVAEIARTLHKSAVFDLDEKIAKTISSNRVKNDVAWQALTPRHLLSHTSGLPNWSGDSRDPGRSDPLTFDFKPGSAFQYSGEGYGLLLTFLEAKSGQSAQELSKQLFDELGMTRSTLIAHNFEGHYARGHWRTSPGRAGWKTLEPIAAYSLFTNAEDYAKLLRHIVRNHSAGLVDSDPFPEVQIEFKTSSSGETLGWSLGWGTLQREQDTIYFQWGDNGAFRSFAAFDPITQNAIVYFSNGSFGTIYSDELAAPVLGNIETASSWFSGETKEIARLWLKF